MNPFTLVIFHLGVLYFLKKRDTTNDKVELESDYCLTVYVCDSFLICTGVHSV